MKCAKTHTNTGLCILKTKTVKRSGLALGPPCILC